MIRNNRVLLELVRSEWFLMPQFAASLFPLAWKFAHGEVITDDLYAGFKRAQPQSWKDDDDDDAQPEPQCYFLSQSNEVKYEPDAAEDGMVAVVNYEGVLTKESSSLSAGVQENTNFIKSVAQSRNVIATVLKFDTPGGSSKAIARSADVIKQTGKPMLAYIEDLCCSAGMYLSSGVDEIYASHKTDTLGSIGTMCAWTDWSAAYEKHGVKFHEYYAEQSTLKNAEVREAEAGKPERIIQSLTRSNAEFIATVIANRSNKLTIDAKHDAFKGAVFPASDAMSFGLIDGLLSFESVVERAREMAAKQFKRIAL